MSLSLSVLDRSGVVYLMIGTIALVLSIVAISDFLKCDYVQVRDVSQWSSTAGFTTLQFVQLLLSTITLPVGVVFMLIFAVQSSKSQWNLYLKLFTYFLCSSFCVIATSRSFFEAREILSCGVFCFGQDATQNATNDAARIFISCIYFFVFLGLFLLFTHLLMQTNFNVDYISEKRTNARSSSSAAQRATNDSSGRRQVDTRRSENAEEYGLEDSEERPLMSGHHAANSAHAQTPRTPTHVPMSTGGFRQLPVNMKKHQRQVLIGAVIMTFLVLFPLIFVAATILPTWWDRFTKYDIQKYESLIVSQRNGPYWMIPLSDTVNMKIFPDILMYYGSLYAVLIVSVLSERYPNVRLYLLNRPSSMRGYCVGEACLGASILSLLFVQFGYWYYWHAWEDKEFDSFTTAERAARSTGQLLNLTVGLLILPITRNSVWVRIFGVPWESLVRLHTVLGYVVLALIAIHAGFWSLVYASNNTFPSDLYSIPNQYHPTNFTIPLAAFTAFIMFIVMGVLAHYSFRRWNYDLFYWSHHFFMVVFLVMLWHATMAWYYIVGGLALWVADHVIRLQHCLTTTAEVRFIEVASDGKTTRFGYTITEHANIFFGDNPFVPAPSRPIYHLMGQYCFVNIPDISQLAWHPFSIASTPQESVVTHLVRSRGSEEWTGRLLRLAKAVSSSANPSSLYPRVVVNIDGPYGVPIAVEKYKAILMIAGGIGITPIHCCYRHMFNGHVLGYDKWTFGHLKSIRLIWVMKSLHDFKLFQDSFAEMSREYSAQMRGMRGGQEDGPVFTYAIFVTGQNAQSEAMEGNEIPDNVLSSKKYSTSHSTTSHSISYPESSHNLHRKGDDSDILQQKILYSGGSPAVAAQVITSKPFDRSQPGKHSGSSKFDLSDPADFEESADEHGTAYNDSILVKTGTASRIRGSMASSSASSAGIEEAYQLRYQRGRPSLDGEMKALAPYGTDALVYCCGPASLITDAATISRGYGLHFRSEPFEL